MSYDVLEKELKTLPESYLSAIMDFIVLLKAHDELAAKGSRKTSRTPGIGKDPNFFMAPDFDETPECFKEYM